LESNKNAQYGSAVVTNARKKLEFGKDVNTGDDVVANMAPFAICSS
jgi:hypothetical protein